MKIKKIAIIILITFLSNLVKADEGMWLTQLLDELVMKDMKKRGLKLNASDIYDVNKASLKDAIVSFGGFCTAEVISKEGLLLTNHHCGFDAIQNHTSLENNYLKNGFWAKNKKEEIPNEGLFATFIIRINDVTNLALKNITKNLTESERQSIIDKNINEIKKITKIESYQNLVIRPFFEGNKYYAFVVETYKDVRLVGAPPSLIGNYGKDTDNWVWPRHTADFSMFRIYAGADNKPAEYSPNNIPYKPKKALEISLKGLKENDFTMIFGFPGRTQEYIHSSLLQQTITTTNPIKIAIRKKALEILDAEMRKDENIKIKYAAKYAGIENAYKKWSGELVGLNRTRALDKKINYENNLLLKKSATIDIQKLLNDLDQNYKSQTTFANATSIYNEIKSKLEIFAVNDQFNTLNKALKENNVEKINASKSKINIWAGNFYKEYDAKVDEKLFGEMLKFYCENQPQSYCSKFVLDEVLKYKSNYQELAHYLYSQTWLDSKDEVLAILEKPITDEKFVLENDYAIKFLSEINNHYNSTILPTEINYNLKFNQLRREYMQAQIDLQKEKRFFPDANSTLRLSYGNVKPYIARDAVSYDCFTYLDGVIEKYKPNDYEFDLPSKLLTLYKNNDYGIYKAANGKMPVCFIGTNHTTGGNSGSPALNAYGQLVGLNFDRVWEGTMSDINYDPSICRNIMVDIRYILFIIDKYADANHLIKEMVIVK